jgi:hypothetical protein
MSAPTGFQADPDLRLSAPLALRARKLFNLLLLQAVDDLPQRISHSLPLDVLSLVLTPAELASDLRSLCQTTLHWDETNGNWGTSPLLASAGRQNKEIGYALSPVLAQLLAHAPGRARVQSAMQSADTAGHALALYTLCAPWTGAGRTPWWPVDQVRAALGCEASAYYAEFKHFNAKVLKQAMAELAGGSDLLIAMRVRRDGRTVSALRFDVLLRAEMTVTEPPAPDCPDALDRLRQQGVSERLARYLLARGEAVTLPRAATRAQRLAVIHRLISSRSRHQQEADKAAFLARISDPMHRQDFERFSWMSSRNAAAIAEFWETRAPEAFAALRQSR